MFHSALVKSPRGISMLPPLDCSSVGHAESRSVLTKCGTADVQWTCFLLGGFCSSWGQVFQAIAELQAPEAKGCWFLLWLGIFGMSMHAGMQLEGIKIKEDRVVACGKKGALC